jgi:hypothetical protein
MYKAAIMKATGCSRDVAPVVEGIMRAASGGVLDSLTPAEFNRSAKDGFAAYAALRADGEDALIEQFRKEGA